MLIDNFVDVLLVDVGVPHALGVNRNYGALFTAIHAAGVIDTTFARAGKLELFDFFFRIIAHRLRVFIRATSAAIVALVDAKENMVLVVRTHGEIKNQKGRIIACAMGLGGRGKRSRLVQLIVFEMIAVSLVYRVFFGVDLNFVEGSLQRVYVQHRC